MNSVNLIGNTGSAPELRYTESGKPVCGFNLAVKGYGGRTDWIPIVAWNKTAELLRQYAGKGAKIGISGRLQIRDWTDEGGNKRRSAEVVADNVYFTESKRSRERDDGYKAPPVESSGFSELDEDDGELPF